MLSGTGFRSVPLWLTQCQTKVLPAKFICWAGMSMGVKRGLPEYLFGNTAKPKNPVFCRFLRRDSSEE